MSIERSILFSGEMVRAIHDARKTQTRRIVACPRWLAGDLDSWRFDRIQNGYRDGVPRSVFEHPDFDEPIGIRCPYGAPGDTLWVRETWSVDGAVARSDDPIRPGMTVRYRADGEREYTTWRSSIHMPRWASRLTLTVEGVRVERLQGISEADARAEGISETQRAPLFLDGLPSKICTTCCEPRELHVGALLACRRVSGGSTFSVFCYRGGFADLWDRINGDRAPWGANPWVWVVEFKRI